LTPTATAAATAFDHFINTMPTHKKVMMRHFQMLVKKDEEMCQIIACAANKLKEKSQRNFSSVEEGRFKTSISIRSTQKTILLQY
jgi:hypothetical protein